MSISKNDVYQEGYKVGNNSPEEYSDSINPYFGTEKCTMWYFGFQDGKDDQPSLTELTYDPMAEMMEGSLGVWYK